MRRLIFSIGVVALMCAFVGSLAAQSSLTTAFNSNAGFDGNQFDITVGTSQIAIYALDVNLQGNGTENVRVFYKTGTKAGSENNAAAWTLHELITVTAQGTDNATNVVFANPLILAPSTVYGFYVTVEAAGTMRYTTAATPQQFSDAFIQLDLGSGHGYPFNNNFNPRVWNGTIYYVPGDPGILLRRGGQPAFGTDDLGAVKTGVTQNLTYAIDNTGVASALNITTPLAAPSNLVNCTATITTQPTGTVAASGNTTLVVDVTPIANGPFSCDLSMASNAAFQATLNWTISGIAGEPEIDIQRPAATSIPSGNTDTVSPSYAGIASDLTYTVDNTAGTAELSLTGTSGLVAQSGASNCTAVIVDPATNPIPAAASDTFTVSVTPTAVGAWSVAISIANDDANENPYTFTISGTATSIYTSTLPFFEGFEAATTNVLTQTSGDFPTWNGTVIGSANYTAAGRVQIGNVPNNVGPATGTGQAGIDFPNGDAAAAMDLHFDLSAYNAASDAIALAFDYAESQFGEEQDIEDGVFISVDGGTTWVANLNVTGNGGAYASRVVDVSAALVAASSNYTSTVIIRFQGQDNAAFNGDGNLFDNIRLELAEPEIDISRGAAVAHTSTDNVTAIGVVTVAMAPLTYTIDNLGLGDLNLTGTTVLVATANPSNCGATVVDPTTNPIPVFGSDTFDVTITPTAAGAWSIDISIDNDDANESPYVFTISGTATATPEPEIELARGAPIVSGNTDTLTSSYAGVASRLLYTISNIGNADLNLTGTTTLVVQSNNANCNAVITDPTVNPIAAATSDTFGVIVTPIAAGAWSIDLSIDNDDSNEDPYLFTISGNAGTIYTSTVPYFEGFESSTSNVLTQSTGDFPTTALGTTTFATSSRVQLGPVVTGTTQTPNTGSGQAGIDFGVPAGGTQAAGAIDFYFDLSTYNAATQTLMFAFMLADDGDEETPEDGLFISLDGGATWAINLIDFAFATQANDTWTAYSVDVSAALVGATLNYTSQVVIRIQAADNFAFGNDGIIIDDVFLGTPPEMDVSRGASIADGGTDTVAISTTGTNLTYTVSNSGDLPLNLTGTPEVVVTAGGNIAALTVTTAPASVVAGSGSTTFVVNAVATAAGPYDFTISIANNDSDEDPYNFTVSGTAVVNAPPVVTVGASNWVDQGGGLFTLTLAPGATINDALTATDPTPDNMSLTVTPPATALTTLTGQPATAGAAAGPLSLLWVGTADASNTPGDYDWAIDINDGTSTVSITARIIVTDVAPTHAILNATGGDGSTGTPYTASYAVGATVANSIDLATVSDANTGQSVSLSGSSQTSGPAGGTGFTFSLGAGSLTVAPAGTLVGADIGVQVFDVTVTDGTTPVVITVSLTVVANVPPVVTVTGSAWVNAGGGLFTLTLNPGDNINDALTVTDATPDNMTTTVTAPGTAPTTLTAEPVSNATPTAGPLSLAWAGTADANNPPGDYDWAIDINDGFSSTVITARIIITDVTPTHVIDSATGGDGSSGTPYTASYAVGATTAAGINLATVTDANTGQTLIISGTSQTSGPTIGSGFTFSLSTGTLAVAPTATLVANDIGVQVFDVTVTDGSNPVVISVSLTVVTNVPPAVAVTGSNWVDAGGGLFTLTLNPGDPINDALTVTDATPDNMTTTVTAPGTAPTTLTAEPVSNATPTAGPLSLQWTGTADASNTPGDYDWAIDINDGFTTTAITARIIINDIAPTHVIDSATGGNGGSGTPYTASYIVGDATTVIYNLATIADANTGQTHTISGTSQASGPTTGSGFTFSISPGTLSVAPTAALIAADAGAAQVFDVTITDGANPVVITVSIQVSTVSGGISFTNTSPLASGTVAAVYATVTMAAAGGTAPYTYAVVSGSLPAGLSLNTTTGDITGTPTAAGTVAFNIRAIDSTNDSGEATFQITIAAAGGGGGGGGGGDDDGGCAVGASGTNVWLALLGLLGLVAVTRLRREVA